MIIIETKDGQFHYITGSDSHEQILLISKYHGGIKTSWNIKDTISFVKENIKEIKKCLSKYEVKDGDK